MNEDGASEGRSVPFHPSIARRVEEAAYLTAPNAERYRVIVHFFYRQYVEQRDWLTTEQVWRHVHEHFDSSYTVERCVLGAEGGDRWVRPEPLPEGTATLAHPAIPSGPRCGGSSSASRVSADLAGPMSPTIFRAKGLRFFFFPWRKRECTSTCSGRKARPKYGWSPRSKSQRARTQQQDAGVRVAADRGARE
jgi:hypothetical protein